MELPLNEEERILVKTALENYLAYIRERIYKVEVYKENPTLKREEVLLVELLKRLQG